MAFVLAYAKQIAEGHMGKGSNIKDCVITIPASFRHEARPRPGQLARSPRAARRTPPPARRRGRSAWR